MPENLRITAPIPNSDGILKPNPSSQPPQVEPMDPARVNQPNTQDQNTDSSSLNLLLSRESVFGKFIQQLKQTPSLSETLGKLLLHTVGQADAAPGALPKEPLLKELAAALSRNPADLKSDLLFQLKNNTLFSGPLFQLLGHLSEQAADPQLDLRIAGFLKAFDGFFSAENTTDAILSNLNQIERRIPSNYAHQLALLAEKLNISDPAGAADRNLDILKKEILPFLSAYVSKSSDYGKMRETLSILLQNVSILNISSHKNLESQFRQLTDYCAHRVSEPALRLINSFYSSLVESPPKEEKNEFLHSLLALLSGGTDHKSSGASQAVREDISRSLLLDNSVYMPFTHIFLPAVLQDRFIFSQIWIERKDAFSEEGHTGTAETPEHLYLSFEIQDLGYFEAKVTVTGKKIDLALSCPEKLLALGGSITSSLNQILTRNSLTVGDVKLSTSEKPEIPQLILQKTMERKQTIDVTI